MIGINDWGLFETDAARGSDDIYPGNISTGNKRGFHVYGVISEI